MYLLTQRGRSGRASCWPTGLWLATKAVLQLPPRGVCATKRAQTLFDKNTPNFPQTEGVRNPEPPPKAAQGLGAPATPPGLPHCGTGVKPSKSRHFGPHRLGAPPASLPGGAGQTGRPSPPGRRPQAAPEWRRERPVPLRPLERRPGHSPTRPPKRPRREEGETLHPTPSPSPRPHSAMAAPAPPLRAEPRRPPPPQNVRRLLPAPPAAGSTAPLGVGGGRAPGPLRPIGPSPSRPHRPRPAPGTRRRPRGAPAGEGRGQEMRQEAGAAGGR